MIILLTCVMFAVGLLAGGLGALFLARKKRELYNQVMGEEMDDLLQY